MLRDAHPAIAGVLRTATTIHVLGAGLNPEKPAHRAIHDLDGKGWRLVPVHPRDAGGAILGRPIRPALEDGIVPEIVVFFLAPERAKQAVRELTVRYGMESMPLLWFQPGSEHEDVLEMLNEAGILTSWTTASCALLNATTLSATTTIKPPRGTFRSVRKTEAVVRFGRWKHRCRRSPLLRRRSNGAGTLWILSGPITPLRDTCVRWLGPTRRCLSLRFAWPETRSHGSSAATASMVNNVPPPPNTA